MSGLIIFLQVWAVLVTTAIWCVSIRIASEEEMIFEGLDRFLKRMLPKWIYKPLWGCMYCMASIHGSFIFLTFGINVIGLELYLWPLVCLCAIGVNGLVGELYYAIRKQAD